MSSMRPDIQPADKASNPIIWADVPDNSIVRVGNTYYMASTTMHMSPGLPIMKSTDLVHWNLVGYAYETLEDDDGFNLRNGKDHYGGGSWASSLRYHKGTYYATTFCGATHKTYIFTTRDIEKGPWRRHAFSTALHDHSLHFGDDDRVYMIHGAGDLRLTELDPDLTGTLVGGADQVIVPDASRVVGKPVGLPAEGSQLWKVDGRYYLFNITWPRGGMRTQIVHRADRLTGPWEGRVVLQDRGIAQGGIVDTPDGKWFAYLFQDHGAVGRIPYILPMTWHDDWPVLGVEGKAPDRLDIPTKTRPLGNIVESDEFDRAPDDRPLPLAWQWNHNPDARNWSLSARPGFLRLTSGRVDSDLLHARNTLTQRTFGPTSTATASFDVTNQRDGDLSGMVALQKRFGLIGIKREGDRRFVVMISNETQTPTELARVPLNGSTVQLRVECDFRGGKDVARFFYSVDAGAWQLLGGELKMSYTLPHFMGYRFGIFHYATKEAGGWVDVDWFRVGEKLSD